MRVHALTHRHTHTHAYVNAQVHTHTHARTHALNIMQQSTTQPKLQRLQLYLVELYCNSERTFLKKSQIANLLQLWAITCHIHHVYYHHKIQVFPRSNRQPKTKTASKTLPTTCTSYVFGCVASFFFGVVVGWGWDGMGVNCSTYRLAL